MAIMIPTSLDVVMDTTAGERKLFDLFAAVLPDSCVVRYEMLLGEKDYRPDFVVIEPARGVLIIEVKDWSVDRIDKATVEQFYVRGIGGNSSSRPFKNPGWKCQVYLRHTREHLSAMPALRNSDDRLNVKTEYFVAFPNITRVEFLQQGLQKIIPTEHVLLKEDLTSNGRTFALRYHQLMPAAVAPLDANQVEAVVKALLPDIAIRHVWPGFIRKEAAVVDAQTSTIETYNLSLEQEQIAKSLGEGPRLLRGIAGTGKTLIMLYRAKLLAANNPVARVLVLCWNISLGNYMQQVYDQLQFKAEGQVTIQHFADFSRKLFNQYGRANCGYDDQMFIERLGELPIQEADKFDAVFVDEAQDFKKAWIEFLYERLLRGVPDQRNMLIAADDAQRIYPGRDFSWDDLKVPFKQGSRVLKTICRNSARVWAFAAFLLEEKASYVETEGELRFAPKKGYDPYIEAYPTINAQLKGCVVKIQDILREGYAPRNILVLYKDKRVGKVELAEPLYHLIREAKIPCDWITREQASKGSFQWEADTVKLSTVHSAKGMDAPVVIVVGAESFQAAESRSNLGETRLMYVALTRAREYLVVLHSGQGGLVPQLKECEAKYREYMPWILDMERQSLSGISEPVKPAEVIAPAKLDGQAQSHLRKIVAEQEAIWLDYRRLKNLLNDYCGEAKREINLIVMAAEQGVAAELARRSPSEPLDLLYTRLRRRLEDETGLASANAQWAIQSWADALNVH